MAYDRSLSNLGFAELLRGRAIFRGPRSPSVAVRDSSVESGFTLIEVILVMAILVAIAAMTLPSLSGVFTRSQLRNGGEVVRSAWGKARLAAMDSGQPYLFRCQLKGGEFQLLNIAELAAAGGQSAGPTGNVVEPDGSWRLAFDRLPAGVVFAKGEFAPSQLMDAMFAGVANAAWAGPIVFYPDGTCTDATILLSNENESTIRVTLRGITGTALIGDVGKEAVQ